MKQRSSAGCRLTGDLCHSVGDGPPNSSKCKFQTELDNSRLGCRYKFTGRRIQVHHWPLIVDVVQAIYRLRAELQPQALRKREVAEQRQVYAMESVTAQWLHHAQNVDGDWGGGPGVTSSIEETALALQALSSSPDPDSREAIERGIAWLAESTSSGLRTPATPIGLYFARLWYFEELYPLIFAAAAAVRVRNALEAFDAAGCASENGIWRSP